MHLELHRRKRLYSTQTLKLMTKPIRSINTTRTYKSIFIASTLLITTSCATQAPSPSVYEREINTDKSRNTTTVTKPQPQVLGTATPLPERNINIERAQYYQDLASNGSSEQQIDAQLSAAENYIQAQRYTDAEQRVTGLATQGLNKVQRDRLAIINAYISYERGDYYGALSRLNTLLLEIKPVSQEPPTEPDATPIDAGQQLEAPDGSLITPEKVPAKPTVVRHKALNTQQVDALLLSSFCYQQTGNYEGAIDALITRESALSGASRAETTRYIWQVINNIDTIQRQSIIQTSPNPLVVNRLEQSLEGQLSSREVAPIQFSQWRDEATQESTNKQVVNSVWTAESPRKIAVLLPLNSKFNKAAQAVMDGIKYQNQINTSAFRPEIQFYDIGANPAQAPQYYNAAIQSGADFIIGPLGKNYANQASRSSNSRVPTILLGGDSPIGGSTTRLTRSPESEGIRVAERALQDGHINAAILASDSGYNRRAIEAFRNHWLQAGGKVNAVVNFDKSKFDHTAELKQMFSINNSESRYTQLSNTLGFKPKFSAYQRNDLDFIFMLTDNDSGRIVRPQINFFSGAAIPVYSTSDIFNGIPDSINNMDLDETQFPIMPWVYESKETASYAGQLNMLFAMGADAYLIAGNFNALRQSPESAVNANTGQVTINANSEVSYKPLWAKFSKGKVKLLEPYTGRLSPLPAASPLNGINPSNKKGIYNDETWDSGESKRKTSP